MVLFKFSLLAAVCIFSVSGKKSYVEYPNQGKTITLKVGVVMDKKATENALRTYNYSQNQELIPVIKSLFRSTEKLFDDQILGVRVKLQLKKTRFLKKVDYDVASPKYASIYLAKYCEWQKRIKEREGTDYYSILITGFDMHSFKNGVKDNAIEGLSYRNAYCNKNKSCSVIEWKAEKLVYTFAHELGHSIGMRHDSKERGCSPDSSIMIQKFRNSRSTHVYRWTKCNAADLKTFLESPLSACLRKKTTDGVINEIFGTFHRATPKII